MLSVAGRLRLVGAVHSRNRFAIKVVVVAAVALLTIVSTGVPSMLLLAGACSFAVIANLWISALSGPASWAAGIVTEAALLGGESGVLALVAPHPHHQYVYVLVLVAPLLAALALWGSLVRTGRVRSQSTQDRLSGEPLIALTVIILIEAMFEVIKLRGHDFGLSWAMDGDARNHAVIMRTILSAGGITIKELKAYPAMVNALGAILDGASGRANLRGGVLMARDVQAQAAVFVLSSIAVALLFIAAVTETVPRRPNYVRRLPRYLTVPLLACGSLGIGSFVLGLTLYRGFLSAIGSLAFVLASVVLGMRITRHYSDMALVLLTLSLFLVVSSWTLVVVVPASALLVGCGIAANRLRLAHRTEWGKRASAVTGVTLLASLLCLGGVAGALFENRTNLVTVLSNHGGAEAPNPWLYVWLGVATLIVVVLAPGRQQRFVRLIALLAYVCAGGVVLWVRARDPISGSWSYYAEKMLWLATCSFLWVPFTLVTDLVRKVNDWYSKSGARGLTVILVSVTGSAVLLLGVSDQTVFPLPFAWAIDGSANPSPREVALVIREANIGGSFVLWDYYQYPDDQMGNFWSALMWDYAANGTPHLWPKSHSSFEYWAYFEDGTLASLCKAVTNDPLRVVTRNRNLLFNLRLSCPGYGRDIGLGTSSLPSDVLHAPNPLSAFRHLRTR